MVARYGTVSQTAYKILHDTKKNPKHILNLNYHHWLRPATNRKPTAGINDELK